jgi:hypothetical protein
VRGVSRLLPKATAQKGPVEAEEPHDGTATGHVRGRPDPHNPFVADQRCRRSDVTLLTCELQSAARPRRYIRIAFAILHQPRSCTTSRLLRGF